MPKPTPHFTITIPAPAGNVGEELHTAAKRLKAAKTTMETILAPLQELEAREAKLTEELEKLTVFKTAKELVRFDELRRELALIQEGHEQIAAPGQSARPELLSALGDCDHRARHAVLGPAREGLHAALCQALQGLPIREDAIRALARQTDISRRLQSQTLPEVMFLSERSSSALIALAETYLQITRQIEAGKFQISMNAAGVITAA